MSFTYDELKPFLTTDRARLMSENDLRSLIEDGSRWAAVRPKQFKQWVMRLTESINSLFAPDVRGSDALLFWICLYELFDEGIAHYKRLDSPRSLVSNPQISIKKEMERIYKVVNLLEEMTNQFTEEEMITIEYERHCSAYLFQDAYTLRVEKHGTLLQRKENLDVKEITKRIIPGEIKKYGNEFEMAKEYARRIREKVTELTLLT